jgi:hypothetical protein
MIFCFHDWSKWSEPIDTAHDFHKLQSRYCLKCNKAQVKKIEQPWNIWFGAAAIRARGETK